MEPQQQCLVFQSIYQKMSVCTILILPFHWGENVNIICELIQIISFVARLFSKKTSSYCHSPVVAGGGGMQKL